MHSQTDMVARSIIMAVSKFLWDYYMLWNIGIVWVWSDPDEKVCHFWAHMCNHVRQCLLLLPCGNTDVRQQASKSNDDFCKSLYSVLIFIEHSIPTFLPWRMHHILVTKCLNSLPDVSSFNQIVSRFISCTAIIRQLIQFAITQHSGRPCCLLIISVNCTIIKGFVSVGLI